MNNILNTFDLKIYEYVKAHVKEIHIYSKDIKYQKTSLMYLLLDDDSVIKASEYDYQNFYFLYYYPVESLDGRLGRELDCCYPGYYFRELECSTIVDHGFPEPGTTILLTDEWDLKAD